MIKKLLLFLLLPCVAFAQGDGSFPDDSPIISKSIVFDQKLNRVAPFVALAPGSIVSAQNMRRPAPGVMAGWGPRRGMEKNNTTAISAYPITSLHQFINPTFSVRCFLAQTNDAVYLATNDPPATGTTFGTSKATLTAGAGDMFSDSIGDDWVGAASGTNPIAWSGGTAYPDGFKIVIGGATPSSITITNDGFETGGDPPTGWTENDADAVTGTTSPKTGSKDVEITSAAAGDPTAGIYQDIAAAPGVEYTISYWARRDSLVTATVTNSDFETGGTPPTGWTNSNATSATGTTHYHGGSKDVEVTPTAASSESAGIYQDIAVNASTSYDISYWAYRTYGSFAFSNGTFEAGTTGWTASNATLASGTTDPHGGSKDLEVTPTTASSSTAGGYQDITVEPNTEYTITFWAYRTSASDGSGTYYPGAEADDGVWSVAANTFSSSAAQTLAFGKIVTSGYDYNSFVSFDNVTVPAGSGISEAHVQFTAYADDSGTTCNANMYFENADSGSEPTSVATAQSLSLTSAVAWSSVASWSDGTDYDTPELKTILRTVINRSGWSSGGDVTFAIKDNSSSTGAWRRPSTYSSNGGVEKPELHVTYEAPHPAITVQAYTSADGLISTPVSQTYSPSAATWTQYQSTFTTPATTSYIRLFLASNAVVGAKVEFDDITIAPTSEAYPQTQPSHVMQALNAAKAVLSTLDTQENDPADATWTQYTESVTTPVLCAYIRLYLGAKAPSTDFLNMVEFDDVQVATTSGGPYPSHVMQFLDSGSSVLETASTQNNEPAVGVWTQYSATAISPASTAYIRLYLGCNSTPSGEMVEFDALTSVVAVPPAGLAVTDGYDEVRNSLTTSYIPYPTSIYDPVYVGFRRPVDGIHFYISGTPNSATETMSVYYWQGTTSTWNPVGTLVDGTAISSATLAQSGSMTWTSGPSGETSRVLPGTSDDLYWYKLTPSGTLSSGLTVYKVTVADDMGEIANLWSGYQVFASGCLLDEGAGYADWTAEVTDGTDANVMPLDSLADTSELYVGCEERAQGIIIRMAPGSINGDATVVTVKYWDGDSWVSVGDVVDGTSNGTDSLAQTGMIQWDGASFREVKSIIGGIRIPYYWYQLSWSVALDADVDVWEIAYAAKPDPLSKYEGVVNYNNHALWWPGTGGAGTLDYSQQKYPHVLNGPYAGTTLPIFGGGEVNAITMLGTSAIVSTREPYQTFYLEGPDPAEFTSVLVSDKVGAIAPKTLVSIDNGVLLFNTELQVRAAVFMAADGVYMTDGSTLLNISGPISDYFSTAAGPYIEPGYMDTSYAWLDHEDKTVHFAVPMNIAGSGTQSVLNRELVYAYLTDEWYDLYQRTYAANCGLDVIGSSNEYLTYVGGFLGYVFRTNTGTADSSTKITHKFKTSPILPLQGAINDSLNYLSGLRKIKIKGKADTTSGSVAGVTVYPDGITTGVDAGDISLIRTGYGIVAGSVNVNQKGDEFAFEFTSDILNTKMELYGMTMSYGPIRQGT